MINNHSKGKTYSLKKNMLVLSAPKIHNYYHFAILDWGGRMIL